MNNEFLEKDVYGKKLNMDDKVINRISMDESPIKQHIIELIKSGKIDTTDLEEDSLEDEKKPSFVK